MVNSNCGNYYFTPIIIHIIPQYNHFYSTRHSEINTKEEKKNCESKGEAYMIDALYILFAKRQDFTC